MRRVRFTTLDKVVLAVDWGVGLLYGLAQMHAEASAMWSLGCLYALTVAGPTDE